MKILDPINDARREWRPRKTCPVVAPVSLTNLDEARVATFVAEWLRLEAEYEAKKGTVYEPHAPNAPRGTHECGICHASTNDGHEHHGDNSSSDERGSP